MRAWFRRRQLWLNHQFYNRLDRYLSGYTDQRVSFTHQVGVVLSTVGYVIGDTVLSCGSFLVQMALVMLLLGLSRMPESPSIFELAVGLLFFWAVFSVFILGVILLVNSFVIGLHTLEWANRSVKHPCYYFGLPQAYCYSLPDTLANIDQLTTTLNGHEFTLSANKNKPTDGDDSGTKRFLIEIISQETDCVTLRIINPSMQFQVGQMSIQLC
jgi:hypothetical protein